MNQYPTIFLSFKNIDGLTFANAYGQLKFENGMMDIVLVIWKYTVHGMF